MRIGSLCQGLQGVRAFHVTTAGKAGMGQPLPPQEPIKKELEEADELIWDDGSGHYVEGCLDEWVIMDKVRPRNSNPPHRFLSALSLPSLKLVLILTPLQPLWKPTHEGLSYDRCGHCTPSRRRRVSQSWR